MTIGRIPSVEGGIQPTIVDAKGDLIAATAADTVNRLAVGSNDQVLVADSSASTGLAWKSYGAQFVAGKNKIINGDFGIWQRGTSSTSVGYATADRWYCGTDATFTVSQQTFTPGTAPVAGYEGQYYIRLAKNSGGSYVDLRQYIENVRTFAGQTVTLSFWAKCGSGTESLEPYYSQDFGSGGSAGVSNSITAQTITTSWARYSFTFTLPSVSGKTIGANSYLLIYAARSISSSSARTIDVWGVQLEAGSVATPFTTATGTIQGELAACQRYYQRVDSANASDTRMNTVTVIANSTTVAYGNFAFPVRMRTSPTFGSSTATGWSLGRIAAALTALAQERASQYSSMVKATVASGLTAGNGDWLEAGNNNTAYIEFSAEL